MVFLIGIVNGEIIASNPTTPFTNPNQPNFGNPLNYQYTQPVFTSYYSSSDIGSYWPILNDIDNGQCTANSDFAVMIRPGSCEPAVVRSDLLEEQNVPVFCQLDAVRINPLIKVSSIKSISFKGTYPEGVAGISFHPARAAISSYNTLLGSPLLNNIGYVVIILKRTPKEDDMPEWVAGNLTATVYYDAEKAFGVGRSEFYLPIMNNEEWSAEYKNNGFWYGKGFLRTESIDGDKVRIGLYTDENHKYREVILEKGKQSDLIYFPGFYCMAGLRVQVNDVVGAEDSALLNIDNEQVWVRKGSKILNNRCTINELSALEDNTGAISISCSSVKIDLNVLGGLKASISVAGSISDYAIGDLVFTGGVDKENLNWYLSYTGIIPENVDDLKGKNFAVLIDSVKSPEKSDLGKLVKAMDSIKNSGKQYSKEEFKTEIGKLYGGLLAGKKFILLIGDTYSNIKINNEDKKIILKGFSKTEKNNKLQSNIVENYFNKSSEVVNELLKLYPQEKYNMERIGEVNLWEQISVAKKLGKQDEEERLLRTLIQTYPDSKFYEKALDDLYLVSNYNMNNAYDTVYINNEYHSIGVVKFNPVTNKEKNVFMNIGGQYESFGEGERIGLGKSAKNIENTDDYLVVDKILPAQASFTAHYYEKGSDGKNTGTSRKQESFILKQDEVNNKFAKSVLLRQINVESQAYVSLIPEIRNTDSEANFTFRIGIEKRGLQLSTEKTKEMIKNLNETISKWENLNEKLGKLITGWKGACFATSSVLMLKSLVSGFSGESIARMEVMKSYKERCDTEFKGMSRTECYNKLSSDINKDVSAYALAIDNINKKIKSAEEGYTKEGGLFGMDKYVDGQAAFENLQKNSNGKINITIPGEGVKEIDIKSFRGWEDYKQYMLASDLQGKVSNSTYKYISQQRDAQLYTAWKMQEEKQNIESVKSKLGSDVSIKYLPKKGLVATGWDGEYAEKYPFDIGDNKQKVQAINDGTGTYLLVLGNSDIAKGAGVVAAYKIDRGNAESVSNEKLKEFEKYSFISGGKCENNFLSPKVRYYEVEPSIRMPAIVPFDIKRGWYAKVSNSIGGIVSSQQQGYQSSGAVSFFYVCNVGANGREENMGGDDICQSFNINNYGSVSQFGGCPQLSPAEVQNLAERAQQAIRQAGEQYGKKTISILGQAIETGQPMSGNNLFECQDFMSPEECKILFNVCDPVICPPSRCNLGGAYPVADVIQTGIIGSIVLCLPNIREGVYIPVCLTGIHAGIDAYVSILKSEISCLKTSLETGESVGICDEITSIYLCEFFWRQLAPVLNLIIPKMIEMAYGQNVRGGGEYLTIMHSWDTLNKNIDYFKNNYAQNAFAAFQARNVEEAGTELCRAFVGTSFPTSADALENLLEPESPPQFYAQFSEVPFTDATVPATSQYKVYYHIFAGNDRGIQYAVYIKNPPDSSYYASTERILVETGYVAAGGEADKTKDFTAPAGYKELCVVIGAQEKCGFKQVTTEFAINYLSDKYIQEQANQTGITSEKDCISGKPTSILPMLNLNLQAGLEATAVPQIDLNGVVRVCANQNPGGENSTRWKDVGYCDNSAVRCWIDYDSVKERVSRVSAVDNQLSNVNAILNNADENYTLTEDESMKKLNELRDKINLLKFAKRIGQDNIDNLILDIITQLHILKDKAFLNVYKAEAMSLEASVYRAIVNGLYVDISPSVNQQVAGAVGSTPATPPATPSTPPAVSSWKDEILTNWGDSDLKQGVVIALKKPYSVLLYAYEYNGIWSPILQEDGRNLGYVEGIISFADIATSVTIRGRNAAINNDDKKKFIEDILSALKDNL